jgi:hypothetical protein
MKIRFAFIIATGRRTYGPWLPQNASSDNPQFDPMFAVEV